MGTNLQNLKTNYPEVYTAQEFLDYWVEEGGSVDVLSTKVQERINELCVEIMDQRIALEDKLVAHIPSLEMFHIALQQIPQWEQERYPAPPGPALTSEDLLRDYGMTCGIMLLENQPALKPFDYLEAYLEASDYPPKLVCASFLREFYNAEDTDQYMASIIWPEDEEEVEG